jgi:hypothetical protein
MRDMYQQPFCITQRGQPNMIAGIFGDGRGGSVLCSSRHKNIEGTNHTYPAR